MPGSIVCGVDAGATSEQVVAYAAGLADRLGSPLVLTHVVAGGPPMEFPPVGAVPLGVASPSTSVAAVDSGIGGDAEERDRELRRQLRAEVERLAAACGVAAPDVDVRLGAAPADALRAAAEERGAEAIVVGSRGRSPARAALLGSTSHALAAESPCPVIIVPCS